jgi:hypothetical protein
MTPPQAALQAKRNQHKKEEAARMGGLLLLAIRIS